jgi:hypothetical protein
LLKINAGAGHEGSVSRFEALKRKWKKAGLTIGFRQCRAFIGAGEHKEMEWVKKLEARSG